MLLKFYEIFVQYTQNLWSNMSYRKVNSYCVLLLLRNGPKLVKFPKRTGGLTTNLTTLIYFFRLSTIQNSSKKRRTETSIELRSFWDTGPKRVNLTGKRPLVYTFRGWNAIIVIESSEASKYKNSKFLINLGFNLFGFFYVLQFWAWKPCKGYSQHSKQKRFQTNLHKNSIYTPTSNSQDNPKKIQK